MAERTFREVDIDLDDLADAVVDWFVHDGFDVQDFQEGPAIFIQARKQSLLTTISATSQALNVRLAPLATGFRVTTYAGEWLDKGVGAVATGLALRLLTLPVALGAGAVTGYGIYQQLKLPEQLMEFIEIYVDRHGVALREEESDARRSRRSRRRDYDEVEDELTEPQPAGGRAAPAFCTQCGEPLRGADRFCPSCGAKVGQRPPAAPPATDEPAPTGEHDDDRQS